MTEIVESWQLIGVVVTIVFAMMSANSRAVSKAVQPSRDEIAGMKKGFADVAASLRELTGAVIEGRTKGDRAIQDIAEVKQIAEGVKDVAHRNETAIATLRTHIEANLTPRLSRVEERVESHLEAAPAE